MRMPITTLFNYTQNQQQDEVFEQNKTWTLRNLWISASCCCSSQSMSSPMSDSKAESPVEAMRVLSRDKPKPVDTDRDCKKSREDIWELFSKKSCSFSLFFLGSTP